MNEGLLGLFLIFVGYIVCAAGTQITAIHYNAIDLIIALIRPSVAEDKKAEKRAEILSYLVIALGVLVMILGFVQLYKTAIPNA